MNTQSQLTEWRQEFATNKAPDCLYSPLPGSWRSLLLPPCFRPADAIVFGPAGLVTRINVLIQRGVNNPENCPVPGRQHRVPRILISPRGAGPAGLAVSRVPLATVHSNNGRAGRPEWRKTMKMRRRQWLWGKWSGNLDFLPNLKDWREFHFTKVS